MARTHTLLFLLLVCLVGGVMPACADPPADPEYRKFFVHYTDNRSIPEQALNAVGLTNASIGPGFALIAGVSKYENLGELPPAAADIRNLVSYLRVYEYFSEIVVLQDDDFTEGNLRYFLQAYFPTRLKHFPKSRFLFAFSGHGANDGMDGYLLESSARDLDDRARQINLSVVRTMLKGEIQNGHQVLALINACYGGNFLETSFGNERYVPSKKGAHGLTAGGPNELVYKSKDGEGSQFFDTILSGLDQRADTFPPSANALYPPGDGIITFDELAPWVKLTIRSETSDKVNPLGGDLNPPSKKSLGSFFFINRRRLIDESVVPEWQPPNEGSFGPAGSEAADADFVAALPPLSSADSPQFQYEMQHAEQEIREDSGDTIYFSAESANLRNESVEMILKWAAILEKYPEITITLEGHTSTAESDPGDRGISLAAARAERVTQRLLDAGVDASRITYVAYGNQRPLVIGMDEPNRRVVLAVNQ